ncbi:SUPPRESSOR OF npr1-1 CONSTITUTIVE 1 protein [Nymphaea thermarum]|nr:SUPPRESSOR OF npr1-1 CONSTITUTIVE 1 protein [Nymphaea thermarum]
MVILALVILLILLTVIFRKMRVWIKAETTSDTYSITAESKGTQIIKEKIGTKKVLIILDDVDSRVQLRALVGSRDWFRDGSRIVITTRDTEPLTKNGVKDDEIYELPGLSYDDSMKLFCYHAFRSEKPPSEEYVELCEEAVSSTQGLPLALEVFGSQFFDMETPEKYFEMHDQIRDMGRKVVEDEDKEGKSCSRLWNNPKVIKTLRKQKVPSATSIEGIMFQGEEEASKFSAPCFQEMDRLRLFHVQGAKFKGFPHFPEDLKWLGLPCCQHFQMPTSIPIPKEVTVLDLHYNNDVANVLLKKCISRSMVFDKLKVLDLSWTIITITPDLSMMRCLVKLAFQYCGELVEVHKSVGQLKGLVWLNLSGCVKLKKLPNTICQLTSLEFLSLQHCQNLLYLPKKLGNMTSLKHLDLRTGGCHIRSLPDSMRKLHILGHLLIDDNLREIATASNSDDLVAASKLICCSAYVLEVLPDQCCRMKTQLELIDNTVEELTETFIRWENLELLILNCRSLKSLPAGVGKLQKLKVFEVYSDNHILIDDALPLASIEKLVLKCAVLECVFSFNKKTQNLKNLTLESKKMQVLADWIGSWSKLEILELRGCKIMESKVPADHFNTLRIPFVFENLKILSLDGDPINITPSFSYLPSLEKLMLMNCKELIEVHESIGSLKKLQFLKIRGCTMLERLPDNICELRSLQTLDLKGCVNLSSFPEHLSSFPEQLVDHMELLEELCLDRTGIRSLPTALMAKLPTSLRSLSIKNCLSLKSNIPGSLISSLVSMRELHVIGSIFKGMSDNDFFELKSTGSLRASTSWEFIDSLPISFCESILKLCFTNQKIEKLTDSIGWFGHAESLTLRCKILKTLPNSIGQLKNLKDLIVKCHTLALFDSIYFLVSLQSLKVECVEFEPPPFSSTTLGTSTADQSNKSTELTLRNCEMLTEVHDSVGTLEKLRSLEIKGCNALEGLPHTISHLTSLRILFLSQHFNLSSSPEKLRDMELLKNLGIHETGIKSILTSIEKLTQLVNLNLKESCPNWGNFVVSKWVISSSCSQWEISSSCSKLVTALSSSLLHSVAKLVIMDVEIEALPDCIAQMPNLVHLGLKCQSLKALPKWIGELEQLRSFALDCDNIPPFIDEMCSLGGLRELSLSGCKNMKHLPNSMRQMGSLEWLDLSETGIVELPPWLGCLRNLTHLKLRNITQNDVLLSGLSHLISLEELDLSGSNFKSLPSCISSFSRLGKLDRALFRRLKSFKMGGNLIAGSSGQQSMSFLFPDVRFSKQNMFRILKLIFNGMISSPVDIAVVMEDDHVLFETRLAEDDFDKDDKGSKTFSFEGTDDKEILEHLKKESGTILILTDVSKLSRVELEVTYWCW